MVTIYKIESDHTGYTLTPTDTESFLANYCRVFGLQRLRTIWKKPAFYVHDPVKTKDTDFYHVYIGILAFKKRVYDSDLAYELERCGEVLPAVREDTREEFYILNPLACYNCLNRDKTKLRTTPDGKVVIQIYDYAFHSERIGGESIFKIPETHRTTLYASSGLVAPEDEFYHQYHAGGYTGLKFKKVWAENE